MDQQTNEELRQRITELEAELKRLKTCFFNPSSLATVSVPEAFKPIFDKAQDNVKHYFTDIVADPAKGMIDISSERYLLIRASTLAINFLDTIHKVYADRDPGEAESIGQSILFDIGHTIGMNDARALHQKLGLVDPVEKLSAGPVHFAYTGWAYVNIHEKSNPVPNDDFVITYDHPYSFEAHSWLTAGRQSKHPVCIMNAGYSSGWCEESFGIPLTAVEITCRAKGDDTCTFIMAPPRRIVERIQEFFGIDLDGPSCPIITIPTYFKRKQTEEALRVSERRLGDILEFFPDATMVADADGKITAWNRAMEDLTGIKAKGMIGKGNYEYALPFYGERRPILIDLVLQDDSTYEKTYTNFDRNGDVISGEAYAPHLGTEKKYLYAMATVLRNDEGRIIGAIEAIRDITDHKKIEDDLRRERDFRRTLIESSPSYFVAIKADGTTLMMNNAMLMAMGYTHDEVVGKNYLTNFIPERDRKLVGKVFQRIVHSHDPVVATNRILTKNGDELLVEWRGRSIFKESGEFDYFFGTGIDITARNKAEEKLQHTLDELKRSNRELEQFAYIASHDLQEPLRKVMTFGDRLKTKFSDQIGEKGKDYIDRMQNAAERMQNLINDLLSYSRVTSKAKPFEPVDLNTVTKEVIEDLEVRIKPDIDRIDIMELPVIDADPRQMHQLFHNLMSNALKFRRHGEASIINITCTSEENTCIIKVSDNGVGFDEKHAESIFGIFKRLYSRSEYEGTGVGLAICKKITERHFGTIVASSPPDQGATFTITLPIKQVKKE
jgi:PAS domain S-box-containing protein